MKAREWFELLDATVFPHVTDQKAKNSIWERYRNRLPKPPPEPQKSAEEQYQELLARMKAGG